MTSACMGELLSEGGRAFVDRVTRSAWNYAERCAALQADADAHTAGMHALTTLRLNPASGELGAHLAAIRETFDRARDVHAREVETTARVRETLELDLVVLRTAATALARAHDVVAATIQDPTRLVSSPPSSPRSSDEEYTQIRRASSAELCKWLSLDSGRATTDAAVE